MRVAKKLSPVSRQIFHTELPCCPHCGGPLKLCNYLTWDKTVQTLKGVLSIASRPSHCIDVNCAGFLDRFVSEEGKQIALPGSTYGLDVIVRIGWLRQEGRYTFAEIQKALAGTIQISLTHLRHLYQRVYLPLVACHEREHKDKLDQIVKEQGGLIVTLDGLVPEGGQPQLWFMRELSTGLTLRSGWIGTFDKETFVEFLLPLKTLEWPILAVLSDKQKGLLPAMKEVLPNTPHQLCQPHFLRNLAEPLSTADSSFKVSLRKSVRNEVGKLIRSERVHNNSQSRLLTMTGIFPDNEGLKSEEEEAEIQNNGNKSEVCCMPESTESVDDGAPDKGAGQSTQSAILQTNHEDKDGDILTAQAQAPQIIEHKNASCPSTSKSKDSSSITAEISKDTTEKKEDDAPLAHHEEVINRTTITARKEASLADCESSVASTCQVEQTTEERQAEEPREVPEMPEISGQNNEPVNLGTAQSQFEPTGSSILLDQIEPSTLEPSEISPNSTRASASPTSLPCKESQSGQSDTLLPVPPVPHPTKIPSPEEGIDLSILPEVPEVTNCSKSASNSSVLETASPAIGHNQHNSQIATDLAESSRRQQTAPPSPITESGLAHDSEFVLNDATTDEPIIKTNAASTTPIVDSQAQNDQLLANQVIMQIMRHVRYLLTLKGRPPLRLVGIFMYQRLLLVIELLDDLLAYRYDDYLNSLAKGLKTALAPFGEQFNELKLASIWMEEISNILRHASVAQPLEADPRSSEDVALELRDYLNERLLSNYENDFLRNFAQHLDNISTNYWTGLFHTYDCEILPRTNNGIESHFRDTQRRLLRTTGQKGLTKRILHRYGAWELLPRPSTEAECLEGFLQISREALKREQKRLAEHLQRFEMDIRSPKLIDAKFQKIRHQWFNLPPDTAG